MRIAFLQDLFWGPSKYGILTDFCPPGAEWIGAIESDLERLRHFTGPVAHRRSMSGLKTAPLHRCALGGPGWKWQIAGGFYHTHIYSHILSYSPIHVFTTYSHRNVKIVVQSELTISFGCNSRGLLLRHL